MMTVAKKAVLNELLDSLLADYRKPEDLYSRRPAAIATAQSTLIPPRHPARDF